MSTPSNYVPHHFRAGLVLVNRHSGVKVTLVEKSPRPGATSWVAEMPSGARLVRTQIEFCNHWIEPKN